MDFANRGNRSAQQPQQPMTQKDSSNAPAPQNNKKRMKGVDLGKASSMFVLFGITIIIFALIVAMVFGGKRNKESDLVLEDKYQAVFLDSSDGQVYFGKLSVYNSNTYVLQDIYYVRVENSIQTADNSEQQQANISLAKLGSELHAPEDSMYISKANVLYWENLTDDGQVVTAIKDFKENGEQTTDTTQQTQQQTQQSQASGTQPAGTEQQNDTSGDVQLPATN